MYVIYMEIVDADKSLLAKIRVDQSDDVTIAYALRLEISRGFYGELIDNILKAVSDINPAASGITYSLVIAFEDSKPV